MMDVLVLLLILIFAWQMKVKKEINEEYLTIETCQVWKGFFALVVLFHHLAQNTHDGLFIRYFTLVGFLAVAVFFFFSGYGLQKKYIANDNYKKRYLITRMPTVLVPYIIITAIYWVMHTLCGKVYSIKDIFVSIIEGDPIVSYSWFVINIILFYIVFYVLMQIIKHNYKLMILGAGLFYLLWLYLCRKAGFGEWWYNSSQLLVVGMMWAAYERKIIEFIKAHYYMVVFITTLIFCICFVSPYIISRIALFPGIGIIMKLISAISFTIIVLLFSLKVQIGNRFLKFFGEISFEIYLSQGLFIILLRNSTLNISNDLLWSTLVMLSTMVFSFLFHKLCQFILSQYRKLIM